MSPLRYQKHLRLLSARRQLLAGDATAAQVAHTVGYTSATQFSREYRAFYGLPPVQDITRVRASTTFRDGCRSDEGAVDQAVSMSRSR
ncbi:helix-turn-helix domain-containing protein [Streptomyces canus]|uniref:helix-turn-helix domain-containing protein n=1 Tax=Streptomyces canus TaxID=58343 RepID=UPI003251E702